MPYKVPIRLPKLHPGQLEVYKSKKRFTLLVCGRRWGKSKLALLITLEAALTDPGAYWYISPTYPMSVPAWRAFKNMVRRLPGCTIREADRSVDFSNGSVVVFKSADREDSLRSEGLKGAVLDEGAFIRAGVWEKEIRPALADHHGWVLICSTPSGKNWLFLLYIRASQDKEWAVFKKPTRDNPHIPESELEAARSEMPEAIYKQEFEAEFLDDGTAVFKNLDALCRLRPSKPDGHQGHRVYMGVDLAKSNDFTVVSVVCGTCNKQVHLERFNQIDYLVQVEKIAAVYNKWLPRGAVVEANSIGEPIIELLKKKGIKVIRFTTTASTKVELVERLALALESKELVLLDDQVQRDELNIFGISVSKSGNRSYSAPPGGHDDTVMSLGLAYHGCSQAAIQIY